MLEIGPSHFPETPVQSLVPIMSKDTRMVIMLQAWFVLSLAKATALTPS